MLDGSEILKRDVGFKMYGDDAGGPYYYTTVVMWTAR